MTITSSRPKSLVSNSVWNLGLTLWTTIIAFIITPLLIIGIGDEHFGLLTLLTSISGVMAVMNLGMSEATLRYVAFYYGHEDIEGINRVVGSTLTIYTCTGLIGFLVLFFGSPRIVTILAVTPDEYPLVILLLKLTALNFCITLLNGVFDAIPKALQRFDINSKVLFFQSFIQGIGYVVILHNKFGVFELVFWSLLTILLTLIVNIFVAIKLIPGLIPKPSPSKKGFKEVFSYGVFSLITQVLGMVWSQADKILLGTLVGSSAVAYLSVPQTVAMRGSGAIGNVGSVLFPRFSATKDKDELVKLYINSTWILLLATIIIFVPLTVLFPDFLRLWVGGGFAEKSSWIGQIIAFSCIVRGAFIPYDALFKGIGKPKYLAVLYFATGLTSLTVNLILIPIFGLSGAGYAYVVTILWGFGTILFAWMKILRQKNIKPLLNSVALPILIALGMLPGFELIRGIFVPIGWVSLIILGGIYMCITASAVMSVDFLVNRERSNASVLINAIKIFLSPFMKRFYIHLT